jgi:hypothetical protein
VTDPTFFEGAPVRVEGDEDRHFPVGRRQLLGAGVAGGALLHLSRVAPAAADQALDVQILQTAASIENVAVTAYDTILALPLLTSPAANATVKAVLTGARAHHADHALAYNDLAGKLGGKAQSGSNPALAQVVNRERARLAELGGVIDLAVQLETAAAQTYQANLASLADVNAKRLCASILAVESQHMAVFLIAKSLVAARTPDLISLDSGTASRLTEDAGRAGFPDVFAKVDQARPPAEGAVQ